MNRLEDLLREAFPGDEVSVVDRTGGGDHFQVTVASRRFDGLSLSSSTASSTTPSPSRSPMAPSTN